MIPVPFFLWSYIHVSFKFGIKLIAESFSFTIFQSHALLLCCLTFTLPMVFHSCFFKFGIKLIAQSSNFSFFFQILTSVLCASTYNVLFFFGASQKSKYLSLNRLHVVPCAFLIHPGAHVFYSLYLCWQLNANGSTISNHSTTASWFYGAS